MVSMLYRVESILIGKNDTTYYEWKGILDIGYEETPTWRHIGIPSGPMIHQHILSPHVVGVIRVLDLTTLQTALYNTNIDNYSHKAIGTAPLREKFKVGYFKVNAYDHANNAVPIILGNFRVEYISVEPIKVGETVINVHFTADYVVVNSV